MIAIVSEKKWKAFDKKLVEPKNYVIFDATDDENGSLTKYSGVVSESGFNPPTKVVNALLGDKDILDKDRAKKLLKKFLEGKALRVATMGAVKAIVDNNDNLNVFIVMRNKSYRALSKKIAKQMEEIMDTDIKFVHRLGKCEKDDRKCLKKTLKEDDLKVLKKRLKKLESKLK